MSDNVFVFNVLLRTNKIISPIVSTRGFVNGLMVFKVVINSNNFERRSLLFKRSQ